MLIEFFMYTYKFPGQIFKRYPYFQDSESGF